MVATLKVGDGEKSIGLRADMDALPIYENSGKPWASKHPGLMHACGHDGHTTILLGAARYFAETRRFNGTLRLIFQPAEEMINGGEIMVKEGLFDRFPCDVIFGMHNMPESVEDYRRIFSEIKEGKPTGEAKIHINPSGEPRWIDIKYSVIYDEDHTPKFAVLSVLDITESHEKELAYDRYLQTISHDVTSESVMIYLEADLTTGITEKQGGALLPDDFPAIGEKRSEVIQYIVKNYILP